MGSFIANGIDKLLKNCADKQYDLYQKSWRDLRNRLDSMLINTTVLKGDAVRKQCYSLDSLGLHDRYNLIKSNWGLLYADRAMPILKQLESIEIELAKRDGHHQDNR